MTGYEQNIQFQWDLSHQFMRASLECSPKRMGTVSLYPDCVRSNPNHNQSPYLIYLYLFTGILQISPYHNQSYPNIYPYWQWLVFSSLKTRFLDISNHRGHRDQDTEIVEESFLEDVANMLSSGEVPNLFTGDELQAIRANLEKAGKDCWRLKLLTLCWFNTYIYIIILYL